MAHPHASHHKPHQKAREMIRRTGYAVGGRPLSDEQQDREMIAKAIHKHEKHDHPGKPMTKLKTGGSVEGEHSSARLDKAARGGRMKGSKGKKGHTTVNVVVGQGKEPVPVPVPVGGPKIMPPVGMPPAGGMPVPPMGAGVPGQPPTMKKGGRIHMEYGAGGGKGRLEKIEEYGTEPVAKRRRGGKAC